MSEQQENLTNPEEAPDYVSVWTDHINGEYRVSGKILSVLRERWKTKYGERGVFQGSSKFTDELSRLTSDNFYVSNRETRIEFKPKLSGFTTFASPKNEERSSQIRKSDLSLIAKALRSLLAGEELSFHVFDESVSEERGRIKIGDKKELELEEK